jgi:hypothetical protein
MAARILSLMLVVTQLMSWASTPLYLCISKSGSVCVEIGDDNCTCCVDSNHEEHKLESSACCAHCDAEESEDPPVVTLRSACDCTHIPLTIEQDDSIRVSVPSYITVWDVQPAWLHAPQQFFTRGISALVLHWDRRNDPSRHPVDLATTVLRC